MRRLLTTGLVVPILIASVLAAPATSAAVPATEVVPAAEDPAAGSAPRRVEGVADPAPGATPVAAARNHLAGHRDRYRIEAPDRDLVVLGTAGDRGAGTETVRFGQRHRGVPVLGGQYLVHLRGADHGAAGADRVATGASGRYFGGLTVDTAPEVSEQTAQDRARAIVLASLQDSYVSADPQPEPAVEVESHGLVVVPRGTGVLTYHVTVRTADPSRRRPVARQVYVDASAGFPVLDFDSIAYDAAPGTGETLHGPTVPVQADRGPDGAFALLDATRAGRGGPVVSTWDATGYDVQQLSGWWPDGLPRVTSPTTHFAGTATSTGAVDAHVGAGRVVDFYRDRFGRSGLDGQGGEVRSVVGVTAFGQPYVNAFWDGAKMVYGGGDDEYYPLSADLDVVGHEMTHGVIEHSANLVYLGQSGALNEAIADYFGNAIDVETSGTAMSDPEAGLLGEDLCRTRQPRACALRDLNDGATMADDFLGVTTEWDSGGVHYNSTIFSGALWDLRERLDPLVADRIVYTALTEYLTPLDTFEDGREAVLAATRALGLRGATEQTVRKAFDAHGIRPNWERRIGIDSTVLAQDVTATATGPAAAGGWWVASNSNQDGSTPYAVYAGRTGATGPGTRLSPEDGRFHVYPHTDGTTAAWAAYGASNVQILTRRLDGGPVTVLATIGYPLLNLRVDGDTVAFQINHFTGTDVLVMKAGWSSPQFVDGGKYQIQTFFPDLSDGTVSYIKRWPDASGNHVAPVVQDLATGIETVLPELPGGAGAPVMTSRYVVWPVDTDGDRSAISVQRAGRDGTGLHQLLGEDGPDTAALGRVDATDTAVTFDDWPGDDLVNAELPKLFQVPIDGGPPRRVSCNRGAQTWFAADSGNRVVWLDGTLGRTDLVSRPGPARRHC